MGIFDIFSSTPSRAKFAKILLKAAAGSACEGPIHFDADEFRFVIGVQGKQFFNLHNAYRDYCAANRKERPAVIEKYLGAMNTPALPATFDEAKRNLRPTIRGRGMIEYLRLMPVHAPSEQAYCTFSEDAVLMLAYDTEHAIQTLSQSSLNDWGVSFDEALAVAKNNLRDATVSNFEELVPGLFVGAWNDSYETSRILFSDVIYQLNVGSNPVAMIPTRNRLLVASGTNKGALLAMLEYAKNLVQDEGRAVSALMYRFDHGGALAYAPADADVREQLAEFRRSFLADDYASQKELLDKNHEKDGIDIFVATYQLIKGGKTGRVASFGVWTEHVDTLLPEVDLVILVRPCADGEMASKIVQWDDLKASTGEFKIADEGYPARYRVTQFPAQSTLDALAEWEG